MSGSLTAVVPVCGRDRGLIPHFATVFRHCFPSARLVWAIDAADPVSVRGEAVSCEWQSQIRTRAVLDAMVSACAGDGSEWVAKIDVDVACCSPAWLNDARDDSVLIGLQNGRGVLDMLGMAFAIRRRALMEIHAGTDCDDPGPESGAIHRAVRRRHLNEAWLWPHRPREGGCFATITECSKADHYRQIFSLVHCGVAPRTKAETLLAAFADLTPF